jgi:hypothetical protein
MQASGAFYEPTSEARYLSTALTRGPWSDTHQHGGPPAALMGHAIEAIAGDGFQVARITVELLRPVPITELTVSCNLKRGGRMVRTVTAELEAGGERVARASALAIRREAVPLPAGALARAGALPPGPEPGGAFEFPFFRSDTGYHTAMELRVARGHFGAGPTMSWLRMRHPLISGRQQSALERVLVAADSGNGVSFALDTKRYTFVNPDLTVCLFRMPKGEWIGLDAITHLSEQGVGLAEARLHDLDGPVGTGLQTLVLAQR